MKEFLQLYHMSKKLLDVNSFLANEVILSLSSTRTTFSRHESYIIHEILGNGTSGIVYSATNKVCLIC